MLMYALSIAAGIGALIWGADRMVAGAGVIARLLGISPMIIGLTILGFVTSAPEVLVSATAALADATNLAVGNAVGSNIANLGLVLGAAALVTPLTTNSPTLRRELNATTLICIVPVVLFVDGYLGFADGLLLIAGLIAFLLWTVRLGLESRGHDTIEAEFAAEIRHDIGRTQAWVWMGIGLTALLVGANLLVWGAENLARTVGISELIIGITIVAVGTSLPELAVSVLAARKGEHGLALGNIIGSNAFNMLAVIGTAALINPADLDSDFNAVHLPVMLGFAVAFYVMTYNTRNEIRVGRLGGAALLAGFLIYQGYLAAQYI